MLKMRAKVFVSMQVLMTLVLIFLDQLTKKLALMHLSYGLPVKFLPFINWRLLFNTGAAFSFLSHSGSWHGVFFIALASVASIFIIYWLMKLPAYFSIQRTSLLFILSGALGNLIDRVSLGHVVDFIELHYNAYSWPVFNLADSYITLGAILLMLDVALEHKQRR